MRANEFIYVEDEITEGPLGKALGGAAIAGAVGLTANGINHMSKLDVDNFRAPQDQKVAQAPAQQKRDLSTVDAKPKDDPKAQEPETNNEYVPLTKSANEKILAAAAQKAGIVGVELAAFMSQMAHESANFSDMTENNPRIDRYLKNKSLGNHNRNDAERFIGRGFIQLTGRWNYEYMQKKLGIDLTSTWSAAHKAADPKIAAQIAITFWKNRVRPQVDDFTDVAQVTKPINSGLNGLEDRENKFSAIASNMEIDA